MISQLSSFRNNHAFATLLFFNVRLPAFATFLLSQPHAFATIFLLSQPFCLFGNVKKSSFRNKVLVSQQKSPRFATSFLVSHPSPRFATTTSSFRNQFPRFATKSSFRNKKVLVSQPFPSFRNQVLVSQQQSPRFATIFLVSQLCLDENEARKPKSNNVFLLWQEANYNTKIFI